MVLTCYNRGKERIGDVEVRCSTSWGGSVRFARIGEPRRGPEEAVAQLWQNADRLASGIVTEDGVRLRVLYPGRRSSAAGPDFRDCILITDSGETITGDVEVHVTTAGWTAHRHHVDPNYNGVVLHAVLTPSGPSYSQLESLARAPVAVLRSGSEPDGGNPPSARAGGAGVSTDVVQERLDRAGDARFLSKASGFVIEIESGDPDQVLYAGIMDGLGYSANRAPFAALAAAVGMDRLRAVPRELASARLQAARAMLMQASGFIERLPPADALQLREALECLPPVERIAVQWKTFRVRPSNHPSRRIEGAAALIDQCGDDGFVHALSALVRSGNHRTVPKWLAVRPFVGEARARDIAVNVVFPFMYAWGGVTRDHELQACSKDAFVRAPSLVDNEITREMKRFLPDRVDTRGARRQQGLIHLYKHAREVRWLENPQPLIDERPGVRIEGVFTAISAGYRSP